LPLKLQTAKWKKKFRAKFINFYLSKNMFGMCKKASGETNCKGEKVLISWIIDEFSPFCNLSCCASECLLFLKVFYLNHNIFSRLLLTQPEKLNVYKNDSDISWDYTLGEYKQSCFYDFHFVLSLTFIIRFFFFYCSRLVCCY
jgi:hypothetical protein